MSSDDKDTNKSESLDRKEAESSTKKNEVSKPESKIEDVGEKIGGAKKDIYKQRTDEDTGNVALFQVLNEALGITTPQQQLAFDTVSQMLSDAGIEVEQFSDEAMSRMAERAEIKEKMLDTVLPEDESSFKGTVITSTLGAKVLNDLDNAITSYEENPNNKPTNFLGDAAAALGATKHGSNSQYATFEAKNGEVVTIRLSNHNAKVSNFDNHEENRGVSIVISRKANAGMTNDGKANVTEYFYSDKQLRKSEGKPLADILKSIKQTLYSGEYKDTTGLAQVEEVNAENLPELMTHSNSPRVKWLVENTEVVQFMAKQKSLANAANAIRSWLAGNKRGKSFTIELPEQTQAMIRREMGRDFDTHLITANSIAHAKKNHGENGKKLTERSIPLRDEDFALAPYIMTAPDRVVRGSEDLVGRESVRFEKILSNGVVIVVEKEQKNSPDDMETITMWAESSSSNVADAHSKRISPAIDVRNVIIGSDDIAKIIKDAEKAIASDLKIQDSIGFLRDGDIVYGAAVGGRIYLNAERLNPNTPVHEYTHLWDKACKAKNPELWKRGVELMKQTSVWNEVANDSNYSHSDEDGIVTPDLIGRLLLSAGADCRSEPAMT